MKIPFIRRWQEHYLFDAHNLIWEEGVIPEKLKSVIKVKVKLSAYIIVWILEQIVRSLIIDYLKEKNQEYVKIYISMPCTDDLAMHTTGNLKVATRTL